MCALAWSGKLKSKCGCDCADQPCGGLWYVWRNWYMVDPGECSGGVWPALSWSLVQSDELSYADADAAPTEEYIFGGGENVYTYSIARQCTRPENSDAPAPIAAPAYTTPRIVRHWFQECAGSGTSATSCDDCRANGTVGNYVFWVEAEYGAPQPQPCDAPYDNCTGSAPYIECEVYFPCIYLGATCTGDAAPAGVACPEWS